MNQQLNLIKQSMPVCSPPWWAARGHTQTILGHLLPSPQFTEQGETLHLQLDSLSEKLHTIYYKGETNTVIYFFHGLGGSIQSGYMQRMAILARKQGHHVFLSNHRGCGEGAGLAKKPYHSGRSEDISKVIEYGRNRFKAHKHIAVGFSLSGNATLLLAAKYRATIQPDFAISVNPPINLARCSVNLKQGLNKIYERRFIWDLKDYLKKNRPQELVHYSKVKSLLDFDNIFTAPISGFKDGQDYYQTCSAKFYLDQISIPTVILTAQDDPFVSADDYNDIALPDNVFLHLEKHGGHMGYLSQNKAGIERWMDKAIAKYINYFAEL